MAANFNATAFLSNASPTIAIPFAMCAWISDGGDAGNSAFSITNTSSVDIIAFAPNGGAAAYDGIALNQVVYVVASSAWIFVCLRAISTSNYRLDVLNADGSTFHGQDTTTVNPAGLNSVTISGQNGTTGLQAPYLGSVGEFWYTNADIQADGAALDDALLRQIAFGGPFSVPHIAASVVDYRSLRQAIGSSQDTVDAFNSRYGRQTWDNPNGALPLVAPHPPLPYWYVRPGQNKTQLVI